MKVKITLLMIAVDIRFSQKDPRHLKILLDEESMVPPSKYLSTQEEQEILREICSNNLKYDYNWLFKSLSGFRRISVNEVELVYTTYFKYVNDCNKKGKFFTGVDLIDSTKKMDDYYGKLISANGTTIFR